jgi:hypothetical protein
LLKSAVEKHRGHCPAEPFHGGDRQRLPVAIGFTDIFSILDEIALAASSPQGSNRFPRGEADGGHGVFLVR